MVGAANSGWLHRLNASRPRRLEREDLLANRVEIDAPLLHVGDVAQMRRLRRAVTDQHVAVGQFARLHAVQEVLNVILVDVGGSPHYRGLRTAPNWREFVVLPINIEPPQRTAKLNPLARDAGDQRGFKCGGELLRVFQQYVDRSE